MRVSECMTREVRIVDPNETLGEAAQLMGEIDAGFLPVGENDRLVGAITDRDIAVRGVGRGRGPDAKIRDVMSDEVLYCFADDDSEDVLNNLAEIQVRRLPVLDRNKRVVGVVSLSDLAVSGGETHAGEVLREIARPSAQHCQMA